MLEAISAGGSATSSSPLPLLLPLLPPFLCPHCIQTRVGIHGGTYTSSYFDATPAYFGGPLSTALSIPFVAIDRPGYRESTPVAPVPPGSSFHEEWGTRLYRSILPALWAEDAPPPRLLWHRPTPPTVSAPTAPSWRRPCMRSNKPTPPRHPWMGGLSVGGPHHLRLWDARQAHRRSPAGGRPAPVARQYPRRRQGQHTSVAGTVADEVFTRDTALNSPMPLPPPTTEHLRDFAEALPLSARVDTILLPSAPHNLELSYRAPGWYAQSFGFASERAASLVLGKAGEST
ncbi:hypothetical protein SEUCBS139899_008978 [Sporothrix eucalyptigena]